MKAYGAKYKCQCPYCGKTKKDSTRKGSERQKAKKEVKKYLGK